MPVHNFHYAHSFLIKNRSQLLIFHFFLGDPKYGIWVVVGWGGGGGGGGKLLAFRYLVICFLLSRILLPYYFPWREIRNSSNGCGSKTILPFEVLDLTITSHLGQNV